MARQLFIYQNKIVSFFKNVYELSDSPISYDFLFCHFLHCYGKTLNFTFTTFVFISLIFISLKKIADVNIENFNIKLQVSPCVKKYLKKMCGLDMDYQMNLYKY